MTELYLRKNDDVERFGWSRCMVAKVARVYSRAQPVQFMGMFCVRGPGGWRASPSPVFWQPDPQLGHTPYFGLSFDLLGKVYIHDASSAFLHTPIVGVIADNGEICYSRFRHDNYASADGSVWIDGGRDYVRGPVIDPARQVTLTVDGPRLIVQAPNHH